MCECPPIRTDAPPGSSYVLRLKLVLCLFSFIFVSTLVASWGKSLSLLRYLSQFRVNVFGLPGRDWGQKQYLPYSSWPVGWNRSPIPYKRDANRNAYAVPSKECLKGLKRCETITSEFQLNTLFAQVCMHFSHILNACYVEKMQKKYGQIQVQSVCAKTRERTKSLYTQFRSFCVLRSVGSGLGVDGSKCIIALNTGL